MEKLNKLTKPEEFNFYDIYEDNNGVKNIHIFGYVYKGDEDWKNCEFSGFIEPLSEFIEHYKNYSGDCGNYVDEGFCEYAMYEGDHSAEEILDIINNYHGKNAEVFILDFEDITEDTPCGNYVCYY